MKLYLYIFLVLLIFEQNQIYFVLKETKQNSFELPEEQLI